MLKTLKIQCPAKINLTLKILGKRSDGFHDIDSIMQTVSLYDYLTVKIENNPVGNKIVLSGDSDEIPYDEKNLVYKAIELFLSQTLIKNYTINVFIEKNIPIAAGLAGGSTDAAGIIYGLNKLFDNCLSEVELHEMCAKLGSDLNVCLKGGRLQTYGRGEIIKPLDFKSFSLSLIKPEKLGISAKEAYTKFSQKNKNISRNNFENDLEWAIIEDYSELQYIKQKYPTTIMSGSGSTYFGIDTEFTEQAGFWVKNNLKAIPFGIIEI